jgi:hypothetical protein
MQEGRQEILPQRQLNVLITEVSGEAGQLDQRDAESMQGPSTIFMARPHCSLA